jgi:hypothetical protein
LTSLISVFFQPHLDVLGIVIYGVELTLWLGIFACGGYYNLRPWLLDRKKRQHGSANGGRDDGRDGSVHDMPSSTSAFSTSSTNVDAIGLRDRHIATISQA